MVAYIRSSHQFKDADGGCNVTNLYESTNKSIYKKHVSRTIECFRYYYDGQVSCKA